VSPPIRPTSCLQLDVTAAVLAEKKVQQLQSQQEILLQQILPQQVTDILLQRLAGTQEPSSEQVVCSGIEHHNYPSSFSGGQPGNQSSGTDADYGRSDSKFAFERTFSDSLALTRQNVMDLATHHDDVTILFADIKDFTTMSSQLQPSQVMLMLNDLFSQFDALLEEYDVYKVETIGGEEVSV
jgi:hypothetical protein